MRKNFILLFLGIVISVLFLVFSAVVMESIYYEREFSNEMYNQSLYIVVAIIDVVVAWGLAGLFYYVVNSVLFSRWYHWLLIAIIASAAASVAAWMSCNRVFIEDNIDFSTQLTIFSLVNSLIEFVLFTIVSFSVRWWSSNCRHTPIPE